MEEQKNAAVSSAPHPLGSGQTWNTVAYAQNGRFVADLAAPVIALLSPVHGERILDLGCGDGALTEQLQQTGAHVTGLDASPTMVAAARARGLDVLQATATEMHFDRAFDAVFSNAALHWIPAAQQAGMLRNVARALKPGSRFVAEMGGQGNIAAIRTALSLLLARHGLDAEAEAASFFPSPATYTRLLEEAGFRVQSIGLHPRPTPLPGDANGMALWLATFRNGVLDLLPPEHRQQSIADTVSVLRPILSDETGSWTADYVRLRFHAVTPR